MSKFDYMNFTGGTDTEFVVHAKKFTQEKAIELFVAENDWMIDEGELRKPTLEDVTQAQVKYFVSIPENCGYDSDGGGCYTYCETNAKGSFPVWVINFGDIRI